VEVVNFPATQNVTGQVNVANLPLDVNGNLRVTAAGPRTFRFVGVTTQRFQGNGGRAAMTAACAAQYPGARMAFADEYSNTGSPPPVAESAWIQPRPVFIANPYGNQSGMRAFDAAGNAFIINSYTSDCQSWQSQVFAEYGGVITPAGAIGSFNCDAILAVACAAPE